MKKRMLSLLLILALALTMVVPVSAAKPASGLEAWRLSTLTKRATMGDCYVYPYAMTFDASVVKGGSTVLQFKRNKATPRADDHFFVEIYAGSIDVLSQYEYLPEPTETRNYPMSKFLAPSYALGMSWVADSRYRVGDYTLICGVESAQGEFYEQTYFVFELHVVSSAINTTNLEFYIGDEGFFTPGHVSIALDETAIVMPSVLPMNATSERTCTAYIEQPGIATATMDSGYVYVKGVAAGITNLVVRCGKIEARCPVLVGYVSGMQARATQNSLCVGMTDVIQTTFYSSDSRVFVAYRSDHPEVASVKDGVVTAISPGNATITVSAYDFTVNISYTVHYHELPAGTPRTTRTATQPECSVGRCSICGNDQAVNIYQPAIFTDTVSDAWYAAHVDYVYENGLMNGTGEHSFSPNSTVTRAMVATVLWRMEGEPKADSASGFSDVPANQWYTDAIAWAQSQGIVTGYPDGTYRPQNSITREQLATILYRYTKAGGEALVPGADLSGFPDAASVQSYALEGMRWAIASGLINGVAANGQSYIRPGNNATRAQFATIISRYAQREQPVG